MIEIYYYHIYYYILFALNIDGGTKCRRKKMVRVLISHVNIKAANKVELVDTCAMIIVGSNNHAFHFKLCCTSCVNLLCK